MMLPLLLRLCLIATLLAFASAASAEVGSRSASAPFSHSNVHTQE